MRRFLVSLSILIGVLVLALAVARITGGLGFYKIVSSGNYPAYRIGEPFFTSNLIKPVKGNFVVFKGLMPGQKSESIYIFRLVALPGDEVEVRGGELLVNGKNVDQGLTLAHSYFLPNAGVQKLPQDINISSYPLNENFSIVHATKSDLDKVGIHAEPWIQPKGVRREGIQSPDTCFWNTDFYGPVTLPPHKYFVMGDNRENAYDSRFIGFIDESKLAGTVLGKR